MNKEIWKWLRVSAKAVVVGLLQILVDRLAKPPGEPPQSGRTVGMVDRHDPGR